MSDSPLKPILVTVAQARQIINVGNTKLYELIKEGRINTVNVGRSTLVRYADLEALAAGKNDKE